MILALLTGIASVCAESVTGYVKTDKLKVYQSASTSSKVLGTMRKGQTLTVLSTKNGWCQVKNSAGKVGYCKASGLSKTNPDSEKCWVSYGGTLTVRGANGKEAGTAWFGQCFTYVKTENGKTWFKNSKGQLGYFDSDCVTRTNPFKYNDTVYAQCAGKLLYKKAQAKGSGITLKKNTKLTLRAVSDDKNWAIVEYRGKRYYIQYPFIAPEKAPSVGRVYTVTVSGTVCKNANGTGGVLARLSAGDQVRLLGATAYGCKVQTQSGVVGYIGGCALKR